ncbi:hypothetical protein [Bradyrhizobium sp. USDA 4501]
MSVNGAWSNPSVITPNLLHRGEIEVAGDAAHAARRQPLLGGAQQRIGHFVIVDAIEEAECTVAGAVLAVGRVVDRGGDAADRPSIAMR